MKEEVFLTKAREIIDKHVMKTEFTVDEFATLMHQGRTSFYDRMKSITGQTPYELIITARLRMAARLLKKQPDSNISEIAYDSGFTSAKYFGKVFKKHYGHSPTEYSNL